MKQLFNGISNEQILTFTKLLADAEQAKNTTFKGEDLKVTDANREAVLTDAKRQAKAYAASRNKGAQPKSMASASTEEQSLIESVRAWARNRNKRFRGGK